MFLATWVAPTLSLAMLVPLAWRPIADRGVAGLSPTAAVMTAATIQLWLTYGIMNGDPRQIGVNVAVYTVRFALMVATVWACRQHQARLTAVATLLGALSLIAAGKTMVGLVATGLSTVNRTPQATHTIRHGAGPGLSVTGFLMAAAADASWVIYGATHGDTIIVLASSICFAFDVIIVCAARYPEQAVVVATRRLLNRAGRPAETPVYGVAAGD